MGTDPITDQLPEPPGGATPDWPEPPAAEPAPSDNTTLVAVTNSYAEAGFAGQFGVSPQSQVHCYECGANTPPDQVEFASLRRMEGASDPDDMVAVVAIHCPNCGTGGLLTLGYGPDSAAEEGDVLKALNDHRGEEAPSLPADAAPGESKAGARVERT